MRVEFADSEPSGLTHMLGGLIQQNVDRDPELVRHLDGSVVAIEAPDAGVAVTIRLNPDIVVVSNGVAADAHVVISATSERLLRLASAPLRFGLPDAFSRQGREVLGSVLTRRVRIEGLVRHPRRLSSLTRILSVHERSSGMSSRLRWRATLALAGVLLVFTLGGWIVAAALAEPVGPPVGFSGVVTVQPLSGWQFAGERDVAGAPLVRITRGGGNLDIAVFEPFAQDGRTLAARYVSSVLRFQLDRLSVSNRFSDIVLQDGTSALRFTYVGVSRDTGQSIDGEVTVAFTPSGSAVVFDAWAAEGLFAYAQGDLHTMIARAAFS